MSAGEADRCGTGPFGAAACCGASERACVYTKAVLARQAACACASRQAVGEVDVVQCASPSAQAGCIELAALVRERALFALKLPRNGAPLLHAKALQLQCGGLRAVQSALEELQAAQDGHASAPGSAAGSAPVADVQALVDAARARWGSLAEAPWARIVPAIAAWQPRRRVRLPDQ